MESFNEQLIILENKKPHFSEEYTPAKKITLLGNDKIITFLTNIVGKLEIEVFSH